MDEELDVDVLDEVSVVLAGAALLASLVLAPAPLELSVVAVELGLLDVVEVLLERESVL